MGKCASRRPRVIDATGRACHPQSKFWNDSACLAGQLGKGARGQGGGGLAGRGADRKGALPLLLQQARWTVSQVIDDLHQLYVMLCGRQASGTGLKRFPFFFLRLLVRDSLLSSLYSFSIRIT